MHTDDDSTKQFTAEQLERYARHLTLPGFGPEAQARLAAARVLIIGAGGLGSPVALYLAAAGVGHIAIADGDCVDMSNLQRQVIHSTADVGRPKAVSAAESMRALNPDIDVRPIERFLTPEELPDVVARYDFVVEATDSLRMKFVVDEACHRAGVAYSHGAISHYEGHAMTVVPGSARLTDLFPDGPAAAAAANDAAADDRSSSSDERCAASDDRGASSGVRGAEPGVLGVVPGVLGTIQAAEAIKYLTGVGQLLTDRLLRFELLGMSFRVVKLR